MAAAEQLIQQFKQTKTLPHIVTRLAQLINDEDSTLQDFEEVIRQDPALVARLLTLVNSSFFGMSRKVDSISRAVALLGMKNLHNIAVTDAIQGMINTEASSAGFSPEQLWAHSAAVGLCCKMIAERIFSINGDDAYLCGILHDIGLIVELEVARESLFSIIDRLEPGGPSLIELEQEELNTDHGEIGYLLAQEWQISQPLVEAIRDHHHDDRSLSPNSATGILQMAEYIVNQLGFAVKEGLSIPLSAELASHIQKNVEEYKVLAEDLPEELENTTNMYGN
ncbi:HDOD domain-containing protein [Desulfogranum mediterraneum]|uniref:HDOD domain-containing protein n=1 Tax=Desulfogranum mediterraneum TaxID=160661 RepID=UPI0003F945C9|nr:HDOD domain-containing protein [Desulfogranum mediterraneum]